MSDKRRGQALGGAEGQNLSAEDIRLKEKRLNEIQMLDLCTDRRHYLSTVEKKDKIYVDHHLFEAHRAYKQVGTAEHQAAQADSAAINQWNAAWTTLKDDGTEGEELEDIGGGQIHRGSIAKSLGADIPTGEPTLGSHSHRGTSSTRRGMGGRGRGRGGGIIGTRGRGGRTTRVPRTPSSPLAVADSTPTTFGIQDARHGVRSDATRVSSRGKENVHKTAKPIEAVDTKSAVISGPSKTADEKETAQDIKPAPPLGLKRINPIPFSLASPDQFLASIGRSGSQPTQATPVTSGAEGSSTSKAPASEKAKSKEPVSHGIIITLRDEKGSALAKGKSKEKEADQILADEKLAIILDAEWNNDDNKALKLTDRDVAQKIQEEPIEDVNHRLRDELFARQLQAELDRAKPEGVTLTDFSDDAPTPVLQQSTDPDLIPSYGSDSASLGSKVSPDEPSATSLANESSNLIDLEGLVFHSNGVAKTTSVARAPIASSSQSTSALSEQVPEHIPGWRTTIPTALKDNPHVLAAYEAFQASVAAAINAQPASSSVVGAGNGNETEAHETATPPVTRNVAENVTTDPHRGTIMPGSFPKESLVEHTMANSQHTPVVDSSIRSNRRPTVVGSSNPVIGEHLLPSRNGTVSQRASPNPGDVAVIVSDVVSTRDHEGQHNVSGGYGYSPYSSSFSEPRRIRIGPAGVPGEHQTPGGIVVMPDGTWVTSAGRRLMLNSSGLRVEVPNLVVRPPTPGSSDVVGLQQVAEGIKKLGMEDEIQKSQREAKNPFAGPSQSTTPKPTNGEHGHAQSPVTKKHDPFATSAAAPAAASQYLTDPPKKRVRFPDNAITRQYAQGGPSEQKPAVSMSDIAGSASLVPTVGNGVGRGETGKRQVPTSSSSSGATTYPSNDPGAAARAQYGGGAIASNVTIPPHLRVLASSLSSDGTAHASNDPGAAARAQSGGGVLVSNVTPQPASQNASSSAIPPHLRGPQPRSTLLKSTTNASGPIFGEHVSKSALGGGNIHCRGN